MAAKRLLPRGYGDDYSTALQDQLKAWDTFHTLDIGRQENAPRVAETAYRSQATSSKTVTADHKLQQQPVIQLPKLGVEKLRSISSKGSARQPRTSTAVEGARLRPSKTESMEADTPAVQATSQNSGASMVTHPATQGASALQTQPKLTGPLSCLDPKTKQRATTPQGVRNIVVGVLESGGVSQEDWEQSLRTNYRVDPLRPPDWYVSKSPGKHLSTMEGASVDEYLAEPDVTSDELLRQLTQLAWGTSQACSYHPVGMGHKPSLQLPKPGLLLQA